MRYLKLFLSLTLFISFCSQLKAQNPGQGVNGNIDGVMINYEYLDGAKIKLSNGALTTVKYSIDMSRSPNLGAWHPVNMKVGLGYKDGNNYKFFNGGHTFIGDNFLTGKATLTKELTTVIDHSKLPVGSKIYLLYENHKPNVPESGWRIEAYALNATVIAYDFIPGTTSPNPGPGDPVIGIPPAFIAPVAGAVPLYEYVSGINTRLTTVYYSSFPGFTYKRIFGYVFTSATPETVPLYSYAHPTNGNYYYSINYPGPTAYIDAGITCYVYESQLINTFPVYVNYSSPLGNHRYSNYLETFPNYRFDGAKFYILQNSEPVYYPSSNLYRMYNKKTDDRLLTVSPSEVAGSSDWKNEGVIGRVYTNNLKPGTVPLYRVQLNSGPHLFTLSWDEAHMGRYEGIVGYVNSSPESGHLPIYRYKNNNLPHMYTISFNELGNGGNGWTLQGTLGYLLQ